MTPRRRLLRWLWLVPLLVLTLPLVLIALLSTEAGSRWVLQQSAERLRPLGFELAFEQSQGSLLDRLEIVALEFNGAGTSFEAERVLLYWRPRALFDRTLHIAMFRVDGARLVLPPATDDSPQPAVIPDIVLPIAVRLDRLLADGLQIGEGDDRIAIDKIGLSAGLDGQAVVLRDLELRMDGLRLDGQLDMAPRAPHAVAGHLSTRIGSVLLGDDIGTLDAVATLAGNALTPTIDISVNEPATLHLQGSLRLGQAQPGFDLAAEWAEIAWPLRGEAGVHARDGRLVLQGTADDYRLTLDAQLDTEGLPSAGVDVSAVGDLEGVQLRPLEIATLDGRLRVDGTVSWAPAVSWKLAVNVDDINPGGFAADWPGSIAGKVHLDGSFITGSDDGLTLSASMEALSGRLRGQPVSANGDVEVAGGRLYARKLAVSSGPNRVFVDGRADEQLDLAFEIDAPELAALYPGLKGRLAGQGRLGGTPQAPQVVASVEGEGLAYTDLAAQALTLDLDWRESGGSGRVRVAGLDAGGLAGAAVTADIEGTPVSHRLNATAEATDLSVRLAAAGGLQDRTWTGELDHLELAESVLGQWRLDRPARLQLGATQLQSGRACFTQAGARLCAEGGWQQAAGLNLDGSLTGLDLRRLATLIPGEAEIDGRLDGTFTARGPADRPRVAFQLSPGDGVIRVEGDTQQAELAYRNARLDGQFDNDRGKLDMRFDLGDGGRASGAVVLGAQQDGKRALAGEVSADFPNLAMVAGFVPALEQVEGRLHLEAGLGGTLATPRIQGVFEVRDAKARLPAAGVQLTGIELKAHAVGASPMRVSGRMRSGEGALTIDGEIDAWRPEGPGVDVRISGDNFQATRLPEAMVHVSPELRLRGAGPYHLSGALRVPRARIEVRELPSSAVAVSEDEIISGVDTGAPEQGAAVPANLTAKVRVELGDDVTFKGFGMDTGLVGVLDASVDEKGTRLDGKIELRDGRYKAYGQDLQVERGRLLFAGTPTNPDVDLRAYRMSRDNEVKAILAVDGRLSRLRSRVFSEPSLPEAEALAYLLTGKPLNEAGKGDGVDIAGAAISLGLSKGDPLLQELGDRLGLDELSFEGGDNGLQDSALVLGKYLNPDLYLGYSQGLFNPEGAVLLRFRVTERLELESRSGSEQSVDLLYRLEHD